jgi:hypothetical protein
MLKAFFIPVLLLLSGTVSYVAGQNYNLIHYGMEESPAILSNGQWIIYHDRTENGYYWVATNRETGEKKFLRFLQSTWGSFNQGILTEGGLFILSEILSGQYPWNRAVYIYDLNNILPPDPLPVWSTRGASPPNSQVLGYEEGFGRSIAFNEENNLLIITHANGAYVYELGEGNIPKWVRDPVQEITKSDFNWGVLSCSAYGDYLLIGNGENLSLYELGDGGIYLHRGEYQTKFAHHEDPLGRVKYKVYITGIGDSLLLSAGKGPIDSDGTDGVDVFLINKSTYGTMKHINRAYLGDLKARDGQYAIFTPWDGTFVYADDDLLIDLETLSVISKIPRESKNNKGLASLVPSRLHANIEVLPGNKLRFYIAEDYFSPPGEDPSIIKEYNVEVEERITLPRKQPKKGQIFSLNPLGLKGVSKQGIAVITADPGYVIKKLQIGKKVIAAARGKGGWVFNGNLSKKVVVKAKFTRTNHEGYHIPLIYVSIMGVTPKGISEKRWYLKWYQLQEGRYFTTFESPTTWRYEIRHEIMDVNQDGSITTLTLPAHY